MMIEANYKDYTILWLNMDESEADLSERFNLVTIKSGVLLPFEKPLLLVDSLIFLVWLR